MAISATRVRYLDKENKILVKNLEDITSNDILSDFLSPLTNMDWLKQLEGFETLQNIQQNIEDIYNLIEDGDIAKFLGTDFISSLDLSDPLLADLAPAIQYIKGLDDVSLNAFMSGLMDSAADKLYDNPSILHNYYRVTPDIKHQILLTALSTFSDKVSEGLLTTGTLVNTDADKAEDLLNEGIDAVVPAAGVTASIANIGQNDDEDNLDGEALANQLKALSFSNTIVDPNEPVKASYEIPDEFYSQ